MFFCVCITREIQLFFVCLIGPVSSFPQCQVTSDTQNLSRRTPRWVSVPKHSFTKLTLYQGLSWYLSPLELSLPFLRPMVTSFDLKLGWPLETFVTSCTQSRDREVSHSIDAQICGWGWSVTTSRGPTELKQSTTLQDHTKVPVFLNTFPSMSTTDHLQSGRTSLCHVSVSHTNPVTVEDDLTPLTMEGLPLSKLGVIFDYSVHYRCDISIPSVPRMSRVQRTDLVTRDLVSYKNRRTWRRRFTVTVEG